MSPDDYDDEISDRERLEQLLGTPDERAAMKREMDERARVLKRDEVLQSCKAREAERQRPPVADKTYAERAKDAAAWQQFVRGEIDKGVRALTRATAQVVVNEEKAREYADDDLRSIIFDVRSRFDEWETRLLELEARMSKRGPAIKCDGNARAFDVDLLRSEWCH